MSKQFSNSKHPSSTRWQGPQTSLAGRQGLGFRSAWVEPAANVRPGSKSAVTYGLLAGFQHRFAATRTYNEPFQGADGIQESNLGPNTRGYPKTQLPPERDQVLSQTSLTNPFAIAKQMESVWLGEVEIEGVDWDFRLTPPEENIETIRARFISVADYPFEARPDPLE